MITTPLDLVTGAMQKNGAISLGETPTGAEATAGLVLLNEMLEMWSTEELMVSGEVSNVYALSVGKSSYTMGPGGDITTRPVRIAQAYTRDANGNDTPIYVTNNAEEYADVTAKGTATSLPFMLYDAGGNPLRTIYLWGIPSTGGFSLVLWTWGFISGFTTLSQQLNLEQGYAGAIKNNLALFMCPEYSVSATPELVEIAKITKAQIKRFNYRIGELTVDPALPGAGRPFNIFTG